MKTMDRDAAVFHEDIRRAIDYSYRKGRMGRQHMDALVSRFLLLSASFFLVVLSIWGCLLCL